MLILFIYIRVCVYIYIKTKTNTALDRSQAGELSEETILEHC